MINSFLKTLVFVFLPFIFLSQNDLSQIESTKVEAKAFFKQVEKIELIEIKPICNTIKTPVKVIGFLGFKKKHNSCYERTIINHYKKNDTLIHSINLDRINSSIVLEKEKYALLFDLIYNSPIFEAEIACYNPRNGIVFYDKYGKVVGFLEICFQCHKIYPLEGTPFYKVTDNASFKKIKQLFDKELLDRK